MANEYLNQAEAQDVLARIAEYDARDDIDKDPIMDEIDKAIYSSQPIPTREKTEALSFSRMQQQRIREQSAHAPTVTDVTNAAMSELDAAIARRRFDNSPLAEQEASIHDMRRMKAEAKSRATKSPEQLAGEARDRERLLRDLGRK